MTAYWNYVDALSYAIALTPTKGRSHRFTSDPARWYKAVRDVCEAYRDKMPEAFGDIFFEPGDPPYSPQVDHFLHVLAQAGLMSAPNPAYKLFEMSHAQGAAILRLNAERLGSKKDLLVEIGQRLTTHLGK